MRLLFIGEHPHEIKFLYHEGTEKACALRAVGKASSVGMDLLMSLLGFFTEFYSLAWPELLQEAGSINKNRTSPKALRQNKCLNNIEIVRLISGRIWDTQCS